jgi:hypothetical protein
MTFENFARLGQLEPIAAMMQQSRHMFYASSILFIYEGDEDGEGGHGGEGKEVDTMLRACSSKTSEEGDIRECGERDVSERAPREQILSTGPQTAAGAGGMEDDSGCLPRTRSPDLTADELERMDAEAKITVRMIDFAHVLVFPQEEEGGDQSYACGLQNLMAVLRGISEGVSAEDIPIRNYSQDSSLHRHCQCTKGKPARDLHKRQMEMRRREANQREPGAQGEGGSATSPKSSPKSHKKSQKSPGGPVREKGREGGPANGWLSEGASVENALCREHIL